MGLSGPFLLPKDCPADLSEPLPYGSSSMGLSGPFLLLKDCPVGLSGLEPPTSRLSGVRSNQLSYKPSDSGSHLLSHAVSSIVSSAALVLTVVFGMGTGISPERIATGSFPVINLLITEQ